MSIRKQKQKHRQYVTARFKLGLLTEEQATRFKLMFSRCKTAQEQEQVMTALLDFCSSLQNGSDVYARIMQDDSLGLDD